MMCPAASKSAIIHSPRIENPISFRAGDLARFVTEPGVAKVTVDCELAAHRLTVERSDWLGHVPVPKGGSRQLPMTPRLTAAFKTASVSSRRARVVPAGRLAAH
jgi:hypothetical protein